MYARAWYKSPFCSKVINDNVKSGVQWGITCYLTIVRYPKLSREHRTAFPGAIRQSRCGQCRCFANSGEFELKNQRKSVKLAAKKIVHSKVCGTALIGYTPPKRLNKIKDRQYG